MPKRKQFELPPELAQHWYTKREAADRLRVHSTTINRLADDEILTRDHYNGKVIILKQSVNEYLQRYIPEGNGVT